MLALKFDMKHLKKGRRTYHPKRCEYNNKDEDNILNVLSDKKIESA